VYLSIYIVIFISLHFVAYHVFFFYVFYRIYFIDSIIFIL
jgi:hypothetical protein